MTGMKRVKASYDPDNIFPGQLNIAPAKRDAEQDASESTGFCARQRTAAGLAP